MLAYNYSTEPTRAETIPEFSGDFSMHGHWPYANLFEGNVVENIILDHFWGPTGEHNTLFRNLVQMYGIVFTESDNTGLQSNAQNVVGNVITMENDDPPDAAWLSPFFTLYYGLLGSNHFEYANLLDGSVVPANTTALSEVSLYAGGIPDFWPNGLNFPPIGLPNTTTQGAIPAQQRYEAGTGQTLCPEVEPAVGLALPKRDKPLVVFPNPAAAHVHISASASPLQLIDLLGKVWRTIPASASTQLVDLTDLPQGLYVLRSSSNAASATVKLVVQ